MSSMPDTSVEFKDFKRILVIRLSSLGDIILTTPALRLLKELCPEAQIDVVTKAMYQDLWRCHPEVNRIIALHPKQSLYQIIKELRRESYDMVLDLHRKPLTRLFSYLSRSKYKWAYKTQSLKRNLLTYLRWDLFRDVLPISELYVSPLRSAGIKTPLPPSEMYLDPQCIGAMRSYIQENLGVSPEQTSLVALAPGARWANKCWPIERFSHLAKLLHKKMGVPIVLLGGKGDLVLAERFCDQLAELDIPILNSVGQLSIMESAALLKQCQLFVGHDSGLMHMAMALKVPVVALFGPTIKEFSVAFESCFRQVSESLPCRPCSQKGSKVCPKKHHRCLKEISTKRVFSEVQALWSQSL